MKKKLIYIGIFASLLVSCTESLEDKATREAKFGSLSLPVGCWSVARGNCLLAVPSVLAQCA